MKARNSFFRRFWDVTSKSLKSDQGKKAKEVLNLDKSSKSALKCHTQIIADFVITETTPHSKL